MPRRENRSRVARVSARRAVLGQRARVPHSKGDAGDVLHVLRRRPRASERAEARGAGGGADARGDKRAAGGMSEDARDGGDRREEAPLAVTRRDATWRSATRARRDWLLDATWRAGVESRASRSLLDLIV
eukprot:2910-Pelagococcus_subviridis.AAC.5